MKIKLLAACFGAILAAPAGAAWQEASSRHFIVYADDKLERVADYATKLERFDKALRATRGTPDDPVSPRARVVVFVVSDVNAVQKLLGGASGNAAGFYIPRAAETVAVVPRRNDDSDFNALVILLHEYSHHFMYSNYGRAALPAWLIEGFAEFNSTAAFNPDGSILFGSAANFRARGMLDNHIVPISTLLTASPRTLRDPKDVSVFYSRSWLLMHYMTMDPDRRAQFGAYFTAINRGVPLGETAKLLGDPRKLDMQLNAYAAQSTLKGYTVAAAALTIEPVKVRALSAAEVAIMPARIASARGVNGKTAGAVAALARKLAAPYPADPAVQNELAEAEYDAGDDAAAQAAAGRALAADPGSIHALIYAGMARARAAVKARSTDPKLWSEVRSWYVKANRLDPEYALPLVLFYRSFLQAGQVPTASAQAGLLYAHDLAPFDLGLGMTAAHVLLQQNKPAEAKAVLKPIAYNPHAGGLALAAGGVIAAIDQDGAAGALRLVDKKPDAASDRPGADKK